MDYAFEYVHPIEIDEWSYPLDTVVISRQDVFEYASEDIDRVKYFMDSCKEWIQKDIKNG